MNKLGADNLFPTQQTNPSWKSSSRISLKLSTSPPCAPGPFNVGGRWAPHKRTPHLSKLVRPHAWLNPNTEVRIDTVAPGVIQLVQRAWRKQHKRDVVVRKSFSFDHYSISHVEAENYGLMCLSLISSGARFVVTLKLAVRIEKIMPSWWIYSAATRE